MNPFHSLYSNICLAVGFSPLERSDYVAFLVLTGFSAKLSVLSELAMLVLHRAPSLLLCFSYYTYMIFLMMLTVMLSMLMITLSIFILNVPMIFGNRKSWLLKFNLTFTALWTAGIVRLVNFNKRKSQLWSYWCKNRWVCYWEKAIL